MLDILVFCLVDVVEENIIKYVVYVVEVVKEISMSGLFVVSELL